MSMDYNERRRMRYRTDPEYREKRKQYYRNYVKRRRERFLETLEMSDEEWLEKVVRPCWTTQQWKREFEKET
jgi:hypothetical protein